MSVLNEKLDSLSDKDDDPPKKRDPDSRSLETMNRAEFMQAIFDKIEAMLDGKIEPLSKDIKNADEKASKKEIARQIKKAQEAHPDFWEWKEEMGAIANANPSLSVEDVYTLARTKNPDKVVEMDKKFKKGDEKKDEEEEERKPNPDAPFALTPTSGVTIEGSEDMTKDDAAEAAWNKVVGTSSKTV